MNSVYLACNITSIYATFSPDLESEMKDFFYFVIFWQCVLISEVCHVRSGFQHIRFNYGKIHYNVECIYIQLLHPAAS